jgi:hypothetical protein
VGNARAEDLVWHAYLVGVHSAARVPSILNKNPLPRELAS